MRSSDRTGFANVCKRIYNLRLVFAPFYRLSGDKRVMVHRRRYYYNEKPFISVVYFGRLRTFCRYLPQNYLFHKLITSIITATRNQLVRPAVLPTLANMSKSARLSKLHFAINMKRIPVLLADFKSVHFDWHIWQIMRYIYFYNRHCFLWSFAIFLNNLTCHNA